MGAPRVLNGDYRGGSTDMSGSSHPATHATAWKFLSGRILTVRQKHVIMTDFRPPLPGPQSLVMRRS